MVVLRVLKATRLQYGLAHAFSFGDPYVTATPVVMAAQQEYGDSSSIASGWRGSEIGSCMQECQCTSEQVRTHTVISGSTNPVWHTGVLAPFAHLVLHLDYNNHRHIRIEVSNDDGSTANATNSNETAPNDGGASALVFFPTSAILATADLSLHDLELPKCGEVDLISDSTGTANVSTSNGIYDFAGAIRDAIQQRAPSRRLSLQLSTGLWPSQSFLQLQS